MQNCRRKAPDKIVSTDGWAHGRPDGQQWRFQYTPLHFVLGGIKKKKKKLTARGPASTMSPG